MKKTLTLLALFFIYNNANAQTNPQEIIDKFFNVYKQKSPLEAVDYIFSTSPFSKDVSEGVDDLKRQLKKQIDADGKFYGVDVLSKAKAGPNFIIFSYLVRHEREPLTFDFIFYKPNDKWQLQNFKFHNKTDEELEEAVKVLYKKENIE